MPGTIQTLTLQAIPRLPAATARFTITTGGTEGGAEGGAGNITAPATVTIPPEASFTTFDIALAAGATPGNTGTVSISDAVFIHTDDMNITRTTDTLVIGRELFELGIDGAADTATILVGAQPAGTVNICARTPQVEAAILAQSGVAEMDCAVAPQTRLNTVTMLDLRRALPSTVTTTLKGDDFANLGNLETLHLSDNGLETLPVGLFDAVLDTLTNLSLDGELKVAVSITPRTAAIAPGRIHTLTVQLTRPSPAGVRLQIFKSEGAPITLPTALNSPFIPFVTIPAGMMSATFDTTLTETAVLGDTGTVSLDNSVLVYTDTDGMTQENRVFAVARSLVNRNFADQTHTFTVAAPQPTATFTREHSMINEGNISPSLTSLTLNLDNAPMGPVTITYTVTITGDNIGNDADITLSDGIDNPSAVIGNTANISINADGTQDGIVIFVSPNRDVDTTNEIVTFTVVRIEFAGFTLESENIMCDACDPPGALTVTIIDDDPSVTYALTDPEATEPAVMGGTPDTGTFTLTLRKLHSNQRNSTDRQFFFRFDPSTATDSGLTPGSGPLHSSLTGATRASTDDFGLNVEYMQAGQTTLTVIPLAFSDGTYNNTEVNTPRAGGDTQEVYTFRVIPRYDTDNEGMETVAFGYRVHFPAAGQQAPGGANRLDGTVDGSPGKPAMTISDSTAALPTVEFTRNSSITSVDEPAVGENRTIRFDYAISDIPANNFISLAVNFGTLGPGDVPTPADELPETLEPNLIANTGVIFDSMSRVTYTYNTGHVPATFSGNIRYQISADDNATDDDFNLGITSVVLSGGLVNDITIPGEDILVPNGGRHVTVGGTTYAVQTITIMDAQATPPPVVTLTRAAPFVTEGDTGQFTLSFETVPSGVVTVTYTLEVTGQNASAGDIINITSSNIVPIELVVNGTGNTFTISGVLTGNIVIATQEDDDDQTDELVTLTISRVEIADIILGPDDLVCDDCDPAAAGALSITVLDNDTPTATLTRNRDSVTEGAGTAATFTLALRHVPDGRSTVTFTVKITGSETISPNSFSTGADGRAPGGTAGFRFVSSNADTTLILMRSDGMVPINIDNNTANFNVHITPINDGNSTNEIITYAVTRIRFSGGLTFGPGDIMCNDCDPADSSSLSITIIDVPPPSSNPAAAYDNPADIAIIEGGGTAASTERILILTNVPDDSATVTFTFAGGVAEADAVTAPDLVFSVSGGGESLSIDAGGMGGTFVIPAGTTSAILTFTAAADDDNADERITFSITGINFAGTENNLGPLPDLTINIAESISICDRTDAVETAILAQVAETDCAIAPLTRLLAITELDLQNRSISALQADDFANLSSLEVLNLNRNGLVSLPAGVFDGLPALHTLHLDSNPLNNPPLPARFFDNVLDTLTTLTLYSSLRTTVSIEPRTVTIAPRGFRTLTAQLTRPSPADVRLTITKGGAEADHVGLPATVTIPAGMTSVTFNITLAAGATANSSGTVSFSARVLLYTGTNGVRENTAVVNSLVNPLNTADNTHTFAVYSSPTATFKVFTARTGGTEVTGNPIPITEGSTLFARFMLDRPVISGETLDLSYSGPVTIDPNLDTTNGIKVGDLHFNRFMPNNPQEFGGVNVSVEQTDIQEVMAINDAIPEGQELFRIDVTFRLRFINTPDSVGLLHVTPPGAFVGSTSLNFVIQDVANPSATYALIDAEATEPSGSDTNDADPATFQITLNNLNAAQRGSTSHRLFFRFESSQVSGTPGYGSLPPGINNLADPPDGARDQPAVGDFTIEHVSQNGTITQFMPEGGTYATPNIPISNPPNDTWTHTLRVIPAHDGVVEPTEHLVFGYRVFLNRGGGDLTGVVDGSESATAITIIDTTLPPNATLTRNLPFVLEGGSNNAFVLTLGNVSGGRPATVTYTLEITGDNAAAGDISALRLNAVGRHPIADGTTRTLTITAITTGDPPTITITGVGDADLTKEVITLTIISIEFTNGMTLESGDILGDDVVNGALSITLFDAAAPTFMRVNSTAIAEVDSASALTTNSFGVRLRIHSLPNGHGDGMFSLTIPQGDPNDPSIPIPIVGLDYEYQVYFDASSTTLMTPLTPDNPTVDITIPASDFINGEIEVWFHFRAIDDNYDEDEQTMAVVGDVVFPNALSDSLALTPSSSTLTISMLDDDEVSAELNKSGPPMEGDGANAVPGTFTLALTEAPDADAVVTYTLVGELGTKYTAALDGGSGETLSGTANSVFTIPKASITGTAPGVQGGAQGAASVTFTITPLPDADTNDEDVTLTIHSITFDNGSDHGNLSEDQITSNRQTLTIRDESLPPSADYDSTASITLIESGGTAASTERVLTLTNAPNSDATVSFELAGGTADVAGLDQADIDFSVSGGASPAIENNGMRGTFTIPAGTPETTLTFTARDSTDSTGERITFTITGITFADEGGDTDIPALSPLTINITDPTPSVMTVTVSNPTIAVGEMTTVTFALSNIPARVVHTNGDNVVVLRTEFTFTGFPLPGTFSPNSGDSSVLTFVGSAYDLTISDNIDNWSISNISGSGELVINILPTALTDEAATITMTVTAKDATVLMARNRAARSFGRVGENNNTVLRDLNVTGDLQFTITEAPAPTAAYVSADDVAITESEGGTERTLTLTNAPNSLATVNFELAGGTAHVAGLNQADIDFSVSGGGENLTLNAGGTTGTFTIPAGTPAADLSFTARADDDSTGERITFTITGITFADEGGDTDISALPPLTINITDPTPSRMAVSVSDSPINVGETTTITFALSNIPEKVSGVDVARTEFVFRGFPLPHTFTIPDSNTRVNENPSGGALTFEGQSYDLTISGNIYRWVIRHFQGQSFADLFVDVTPSALTDEAVNVTLAVTAKAASTLTLSYRSMRSYNASDSALRNTDFSNVTGIPLTLVIMDVLSIPEAIYDSTADIAITEGEGPIVRTLTLNNAPDNNAATVSFELGGGTADVAGLDQVDIDFSVSNGGENPTFNADGTTGTFTIPAGTPQAADLSFTARADNDSTGEQLTFTITGIVFGDDSIVAEDDLPDPLIINVTDITSGSIEVSVSSTVINTRETADITFALRNIPSRVAGTGVVAGVEFVFRGFPPQGDFTPNSGDRQATFVSDAYDLRLSNIAGLIGLAWSITDAAPGLTVNVPASALTGGAADITLTVDPKTAAMLTATFDRAQVYDALTVDLGHTINATGSPFTVTILLDPIASYDGGDITLIEGLIPSAMRTLTLSDVPNADANAGFTLTGGVANGTGAAANANVTTPDITITVGGDADMLSLNDGGDGGTFRIPVGAPGDLNVTITFATAPDADTVTETIAFSITEIDFAGTDTDIGRLSTLLITVGESPCDRTPQVHEAIRTRINPTPLTCGDITAAQLRGITSLSITSNVGLTSLKTGDFTGLTGLETLNLNNNRLESLEPGLFVGLTGLETLNLRGNDLSELDSNLFQGLSTLTTLHLSDNALATLPEDIFASLANLDRLNMGGNTRRPADKRPPPPTFSLPANLFNGLSNLRILELKDHANRLTSLHPDLFEGLISLQRLEINGNSGLTSLDPDLLEGLDSLRTLRLNSNPGLTSLPPGFLDDVLDMLNQLFWPPRLPARMLNLSAVSNDLPQGQGVFLQFNLNEPVEAGLGLRISYTVTFGEGGTADHFDGLSAGTVDIAPGMESTTIEVSASRDVPTGTTATIALTPNPAEHDDPRGLFLLYDGDNNDESDEVAPNSNNFVSSLVRVDNDNHEQTLTIVAPTTPSAITAISVTNDPVPEGQPVAVRITLDQPLPEDGGVSYRISPRGSSMPIDSANGDITVTGAPPFANTPRTQTINFRTNQPPFTNRVAIDDNRVEPDLEEGTITINGIFWGESFTGFTPMENDTVDFAIEDNDAINLTLGIEDNDDISVALIAGVYQVRMRESTTALDVSIRAKAAPIPPDPEGVVLDRSITAGLMSSDGTAVNGTDFTFTDLTTTYPENSAAQAAFDPVTATINIHGNNNSGQDREFTLALSSQDRAANINTPPTSARVTIVPDTSADYDSTADITITDGGAGTVERILTLRHAPSTDATVHFDLSGGTALSVSVVTNPDIILDIGGDGGVLSIDPDGMGGNFRIRAGGDGVATLFFRDNPTVISAGTNIGFTITSITFDDPGTVTDIGALSKFTINISSGGNPVAIVRDTIGTLSEAAPANTSSARFTLSILNLPDDHGEGSLQLGIPQRDEGNPRRPRVGDDYRYQHQVGDMLAESPLTRSSSVVDIMIPPGEVSEDGAVDIVFTFTALDDNYDENEAIRIIFTRPVTFQNADPALNLTPSRSNFIIPIADDDQVEATLNEGDQPAVDGEGVGNNTDGTFVLTIANAPDAIGMVLYTLTGEAGKYTASLSDGTQLTSIPSSGVFTIPEADITGTDPNDQEDGPGTARATIVISPLHDGDGDDEDVTLTIHSITFGNGSNHANLDGGNIRGAAVNGSLTLTITDEDPRPDANYTPGGDISITKGDAPVERTLTLVNAPSNIATVEFAFDGGTAGTGTESSITFSVSGVGNLAFNADGTTGTFTIPADTAATILTFAADADSTAGQLTFTITGITFDDNDTITDIGPLAPLNIIITDPTPASLMVSVGNPDLETGQITDIVFALGNVPGRVGGVAVARTEFVFEGFPAADQFTPNSGNPAPLTFVSTNYNLTISNNIRDWSITGVSTGRLTVNVPASALTGRAATVTLTVTAKDVAMLTAAHVMTQVFDAGGTLLPHPFTNTGALEFTIRRPDPTSVTGIEFDSNNVAESGTIVVTVTLDQPLPRDGTLRYTVLAGAAPSISANDVTAGFGEASVSANADSSTFGFTVDVADDNRIDAAEQEAGAINIISVAWEDGGGFPVNDSLTFTITDNDGISLTLGIEDNDDIPVTLIDGEYYQVRVRESIPTLDVSIRAEPAPDPFNPNGVILDRSITASLMSSDGTAFNNTDFTFTDLPATYLENSAPQAAFDPVTATITIRAIDEEKRFTLTLSGDDTPNRARVTIVPDTEADYRSTSDLTIVEGDDGAAFAERTLTLRHAPSTTATVNFALSGGTDRLDVSLVVTDELIDFDSDGGNFQIPAGTAEVTLVFEDNPAVVSAGTNIVFTITGITFDDPGTVTDIGKLPGFTIIINSSDEPAAIVSETTGTLSEALPTDTASFTLNIRNLPANPGNGSFQLTIPQRNTGNPERPRVGDDYSYQHQVGDLSPESPLTSDTSAVDIGIPSNQVVGGTVDIVFTFTAVDDNYDEADEEILIMFTQNVTFPTFPDADLLPALTPSRNNFIISIGDDDRVEATLNKGEPAVDGNDFISDGDNINSTFALTIMKAPDADAMVTYTLAGGADEKYTAFLLDGARLSSASRSVFIIPEADITGDGPDDQGGSPGMARATITISPLHDADGDDEDVTLIIHSITFTNGSGHGDLGGGDILGAAVNGSLTLTITDEDPRPEARYTSDGDISITEGDASTQRTLTLVNAPSNIATVKFTFAGGTVGTDADTESDINFRVSGGGDLTFNADGTTGTFTIPADTAATTLTFTANADPDSTGERILFTITGITFDDPDTITDIGPLAPLAIIITDPTSARLMVSVGNSDLEIGENTDIVFALGNVPEMVRGVAVARTEFVFEGFPRADQFSPNSSTDAQQELTFISGGYNLTISNNIFNWSITNASASTGQLTVSVPASELTGAAATVTLTVTAKDVAMLTANPVMPQVFDAGGTLLPHPFTNTGDLEFTIRRAPPTSADIAFDNDNVAENEDLAVTVTLNQPLPRDGTLTYTVLAGAAPSISTNDVTTGFNEALVSSADAGSNTFEFTVGVADDNRIDAAEQEAGVINIISVAWEDGDGFDDNTSRTFTITDNDSITLRLDAGEYEVRDNAGTLTVTVNAAPNPIPSTHNGVILERTVTANFFTRDGVGVGAATVSEGDYVAVASGSGSAPALAFTVNLNSVAYDIVIENDDDDINETFTVNLGSSDNGVNIPTPEAAVTIVPNTTGDYGSASTTIALAEASGTSATRTLRLSHAPESAATVSFELTNGTAAAARSVFADRHALTLFVDDGATIPTIDDGNSSGRFPVQPGDNEVTLRFEAPADFYGDDETITFSITGITFADEGDDTDTPADALPPDLTINITDVGAAATVTADDDDTGISELALNKAAVIRVRLTDIPSAATTAVIGFTLAGAATLSTDYTVTLAGSSTSVNSVTITKDDIDGDNRGVPQGGAPGHAEATLIFRALNDDPAGIEDETIELIIDSVAFEGAPESDLAGADDIEGSSQTITIADRPLTPFATLSVGEEADVIPEDGGLSDTPNFIITLARIDSHTGTGMMAYEFSDGFSATVSSTDPADGCPGNGETTYCAFIRIAAGSLTRLTTQTGSFTFPVSSVSGEEPIDIFILPREDDDAENETVELEITSITVPQSGETITFNLDNGNLLNPDGDPVSTARITINDSAPPSVTRIEIDNAANIPEGGDIAVAVALNRPLREPATLRYRIHDAQANSANSIAAHDVVAGAFNELTASAPVRLSTIEFTVVVIDDNRIEPTMEQGVIEIVGLDLRDETNTQVLFTANNTATFTIMDNDKIRLSIAGRTVSENIGTFEYTVAAVAAAMPRSETQVVLDRAVTATLTSTDGSAIAGDDDDYDGLSAAIVFPANNVARAALTSTPPVSIGINNDGEVVEENFILALTSNDPAVEIADGTASTITIAPDPRAAFNGTLTLTFTESDGPMTRTLNISNVPDNTTATVSFGVSGGTASPTDNPLHDFILTVADDVSTSILTFSGGNTNVEFTIPADRFINGSTVITLTFTPIADTDSESERIDFGVASLMFPSNSIYDAGAQSPNLLITINEGALQLRIRVFLEGALQ